MPRKLAKTGTEQFLKTLELFEAEVYRHGTFEDFGDETSSFEREREIGKLRNRLIKLYEIRTP